MDAELVFVVDNMQDPLRKVCPFLDPSYEDFIGHQLGSIRTDKGMESRLCKGTMRRNLDVR